MGFWRSSTCPRGLRRQTSASVGCGQGRRSAPIGSGASPPSRGEPSRVLRRPSARHVRADRCRGHPARDPGRPGVLARGPAEPVDLPPDGRRPRRGRLRDPLRGRRARARARLRRARGDPRRGRSHHLLVGGPPVDAARGLPGDPRRGRVRERGRRRLALPARTVLGAGDPARCGHLAHGRGRGVLGAARRAVAQAARRHPRGGVRAERRPHRRPGDAGLDRRAAGERRAGDPWHRGVRAGRRGGVGPGVRLRWRLAVAAYRAAGVGPVPDRGALPRLRRVRRRRGPARQRLRRGLRGRADPWQQRAPAPRCHPVLRRGDRVAGPDRAVRDARATCSRPGGSRSPRWGWRWWPG